MKVDVAVSVPYEAVFIKAGGTLARSFGKSPVRRNIEVRTPVFFTVYS